MNHSLPTLFYRHLNRVLLLFALLVSSKAYACDVCGSGLSAYQTGIWAFSQDNNVGISYSYMSFDTHLSNSRLHTEEKFQVYDIRAKYFLTNEWVLLVNLPYLKGTQTLTSGVEMSSESVSDPTLNLQYTLWDTRNDTISRTFQHQIQLGAGIKVPLGEYQYDESNRDQVQNPNFQTSTGSFDFIGQLQYLISYQEWSWVQRVIGVMTTKNSNNYQFGNQLLVQTTLMRGIDLTNQWHWTPYVSLLWEHSQKDQHLDRVITLSGGSALQSGLGMNLLWESWMLGLDWTHPLTQKYADGELRRNDQWRASLGYLF